MNGKILYLILTGILVGGLLSAVPVSAADTKLMTKEELKNVLNSENLIILDVRTGRDWSSSEFKIKGAVRAQPDKFKSWSSTLDKNKTVVLYCA